MRAHFTTVLACCLLLSCAPSGGGDARQAASGSASRPAISHGRLPLDSIHLPPGFKIDVYASEYCQCGSHRGRYSAS